MVNDDSASGAEPDLGALLGRLIPHLITLEEPILRAAGLSMWEYAIVSEIAATPAVSQRELSERTGRDPTRLGKHLDELQRRGIVSRDRSGSRTSGPSRSRRRGVHYSTASGPRSGPWKTSYSAAPCRTVRRRPSGGC